MAKLPAQYALVHLHVPFGDPFPRVGSPEMYSRSCHFCYLVGMADEVTDCSERVLGGLTKSHDPRQAARSLGAARRQHRNAI
jgi:hypothetical protein